MVTKNTESTQSTITQER